MSAFRRIVSVLPATRRSYSVFSSKSGGGRYFNSAKAKAAEVAAKSDSSPKDTSVSSSTTASAPNQDGTSPSDTQASRTATDSIPSSPSPSPVAPGPTGAAQRGSTGLTSPATELSDAADELASLQTSFNAAHPSVTSNDYKLHQFFSLHRPLLLLNNTPAMFTPAPSFESVLSRSSQEPAKPQPVSVFEDFPTDPSVDADAVAARQLGRALAMSRIGAAVSWEATLKHLGLDPSKEPERIDMQEQLDKDWEVVQILLDSTKRKRRKKMKKHKLKKRRRATRSARLKLK